MCLFSGDGGDEDGSRGSGDLKRREGGFRSEKKEKDFDRDYVSQKTIIPSHDRNHPK